LIFFHGYPMIPLFKEATMSHYERWTEAKQELRQAQNERRRYLRYEEKVVGCYNRARYNSDPRFKSTFAKIMKTYRRSAERALADVREARARMKRADADLVELMGEDWMAPVRERGF
jgi:hypothetical protein